MGEIEGVVHLHSNRFYLELAYCALEHGLGKTRHGSVLGLVWFCLCAILKRKNLTEEKKHE